MKKKTDSNLLPAAFRSEVIWIFPLTARAA
jgi:hypothetical protein